MGERAIFHPDDAARFYAKHAGGPYRPSNGTEGSIFEAAWCDDCRQDAAFRGWFNEDSPRGEQPEGCSILCNVMAYATDDPEYPREWIYGADGQPRCTAFVDKHHPLSPCRCKTTPDLFGEPTHPPPPVRTEGGL